MTITDTNIYLIGNSSEYKDYIDNNYSIKNLPVKNLPVVYFPFNYNSDSNDNVKNNLNKFTNIIYTNIDDSKKTNIQDLFNQVLILEEKWQPFNKNNIKIISIIIIIFWIIILFILLKTIHCYFKKYYTYLMLLTTIILLLIGIIYSFIFTSEKF